MLAGVGDVKNSVAKEPGAEAPRSLAPDGTLARAVRDIYSRASQHRVSSGVEARWLRALRARRGERDERSKAALRAAGMDEDLASQITDVKCNSAKAQLDEVYVNGPNDEFTVDATPVPEIPEEDAAAIFADMMKSVMLAVVSTGAEPDQRLIMAEVDKRYGDRLTAERVFRKRARGAHGAQDARPVGGRRVPRGQGRVRERHRYLRDGAYRGACRGC